MPSPQKLIVGLGNPGADYAATRHNIGFMALDRLAPTASWQKKYQGELQHAELHGVACLLLKPLTYMNLSGQSVGEALRFYKLAPSDTIVIHDDLDLQPGQIKVKQGGGHGGHNGLKSIDAAIGQDYWRIRLGIGHPGDRDAVTPYVLGAFAKADREWVEACLTDSERQLKSLLVGSTKSA
jgi:PTH1 family peptidyl-tRNA hydrolase